MAADKKRKKAGGPSDPDRARYARNNRGRPIFYSPSSASAFAGCNRFWWYSKVMGEKEPPSPALEWGNAVHLVLETYLETGKQVAPGIYKDDRGGDIEVKEDHVVRAWTSLSHLPDPGMGNVEHWASRLPVYDGPDGIMLFAGKIDWHGVYGEPWAPVGPDIPSFFDGIHVLDHKSKKSDGGRYGIPSSDALARNRQGLLYAKVVTHGTQYADSDVLFSHNYILKTGAPRSKRVDTVMRAEDIQSTWEAQAESARLQILTSKAERAEDVPYNRGHCQAFGRPCPFKRICPAWTNQSKTLFDTLSAFDGGTYPAEEKTMSSFWDIADEALAPQAEHPTTVDPEETDPVEVPLGIQPDDAAPHDNDHVRPAFIQDVVQIVSAAFQQQRDSGADPVWSLVTVGKICEREGLSRDWAINVAYLADVHLVESNAIEEISGFDEDKILSVPATSLLSLGDGAEQDRAAALAAAPLAAFRDLADRSPREILLLARPLVDDRKRLVIDELLDDGRLTTPFDGIEETKEGERAALRALYVIHLSGEELTDEVVDKTLKIHGYYRRKTTKTIAAFRDRVTAAGHPEQPAQDTATAEEETAQEEVVEGNHLDTRSLGELIQSLLRGGSKRLVDHATALLTVHEAKIRSESEADQQRLNNAESHVLDLRKQLNEALSATPQISSNTEFTLYAGCRPFSRPVSHIRDFLAEIDERALRKVRMLDGHASIDAWFLADYGKGKQIFIQELRAHLANNPLPAGGEYHFLRNSIYQDIPLAEMFEAAGAKVVLGVYG